MGHSKSDEGHRATESSGDGCKQASDDEQTIACTDDIYPQILRIQIAQHEGVEGFYQKDAAQQSEQGDRGKDGHHVERDASKRAHAPYHIGTHALVGSKEIEQRDSGVGDIAYFIDENTGERFSSNEIINEDRCLKVVFAEETQAKVTGHHIPVMKLICYMTGFLFFIVLAYLATMDRRIHIGQQV